MVPALQRLEVSCLPLPEQVLPSCNSTLGTQQTFLLPFTLAKPNDLRPSPLQHSTCLFRAEPLKEEPSPCQRLDGTPLIAAMQTLLH